MAAEPLQHLASPSDMPGLCVMHAQVTTPAARADFPVAARSAAKPAKAVRAIPHPGRMHDEVVAEDFALVSGPTMVGDDGAGFVALIAMRSTKRALEFSGRGSLGHARPPVTLCDKSRPSSQRRVGALLKAFDFTASVASSHAFAAQFSRAARTSVAASPCL